MGLTVYYSGMLRDVNQIPLLTNEVCDICDQLHWPVHVATPTPDTPLSGVIFFPPESEEVWYTFLPDGRLADLSYFISEDWKNERTPCSLQLDFMTHYAGPDVHMRIVDLMRFLSKKYFDTFHVTDESEYWETGNAEKCRDWFAMFDVWIKDWPGSHSIPFDGGTNTGEFGQDQLKDVVNRKVSFGELVRVIGDPNRGRRN